MPFQSDKQRRFMFAKAPKAAKKWAHGQETKPGDWRGASKAKPRPAAKPDAADYPPDTASAKKRKSRGQLLVEAMQRKKA